MMKGVSREKFEAMSNFTKDKMRDKLDPDKAICGRNEAMLKEIEKHRESLRVLYFERVTNLMLEATKPQTSGEPSQSSQLPELPSRPDGTASGPAMRRTIERVEIADLAPRFARGVTPSRRLKTKPKSSDWKTRSKSSRSRRRR